MTTRLIFPFIIIVLMVAASVAYWIVGDWRHGCYWVAAAIINLVVTV